MEETADYLQVLRWAGLAPRPEMQNYIQSALERFGGPQADSWPASFREQWAAHLLWCGKTVEAELLLEGTVRSNAGAVPQSHRRRALLGNAKRLLGKLDEARSLLEHTRKQQQELRLLGDLADFTLPNLAKLIYQTDASAARTLLAQAKAIQSQNRNRLGHIRTLLLEARLSAPGYVTPPLKEAMLALASQVPCLTTCGLFQRIMKGWEVWTHDLLVLENDDAFWGL